VQRVQNRHSVVYNMTVKELLDKRELPAAGADIAAPVKKGKKAVVG